MTIKRWMFITTIAAALWHSNLASEELKPAAWVPLPAIGSSPETGFQYGIYVMRIFPQQAPDVPQNRGQLLLQGTTEGQYQAYLWPEVYFDQGRWSLNGKFGGKYWPAYYFGDSSNPDDEGDGYANTSIEASVTLSRKLTASFSLGGRFSGEIQDIENQSDDDPDLLTSEVSGYDGGTYTGIGVVSQYNTTNNRDWPTSGFSVAATADLYSELLGSDLDFTIVALDAANFLARGNNVLATRVHVQQASDDTPFTYLPRPSGTSTLRGANGDQWINQSMLGVQAELRMALTPKLAIVSFLDSAKVSDTLSNFSGNQWHYSVGGGARYAMTPDRFNIRFDLGWVDAESISFALTVGEAF